MWGIENKKIPHEYIRAEFLIQQSHSAGDLTRTEATGANVHVLRAAVDDRLDALHIGLPRTIGTTVRVGHLDAEHNALIAKLAFGHDSFNLLAGQSFAHNKASNDMIADIPQKSKY